MNTPASTTVSTHTPTNTAGSASTTGASPDTSPGTSTGTSPGTHPLELPAATYTYLDRAARSLREAITTTEVPQRYAQAHVSALQATAALLAARATPGARRVRRGPQKNAWVLLAEVAPELGEWAAFFAAGAAKRAAAETGSRRAVTEREADDLVRDADRFLGLVEQALGMSRHVPFDDVLPAPWTGPDRVA